MKEESIHIQEIKRLILDYYHAAHVNGDSNLYKEILHPDWKYFRFNDDSNLQIVDRDEYCSWYNPDKIDTSLEWETEFLNVDVYLSNAQVKLTIKNQKFGYLDFFNLMKLHGRWWIVHKLSQPLS